MTDPTLDELAEELAEFAEPEKTGGRSPREERVIAGFEEIQRFIDQHGHIPRHGENKDIFERLYAKRLDRLLILAEYRALLEPLDRHGLLTSMVREPAPVTYGMDDDELMAELALMVPRTSPRYAMSARAPTSEPPRKSLSASRATTSTSSSLSLSRSSGN